MKYLPFCPPDDTQSWLEVLNPMIMESPLGNVIRVCTSSLEGASADDRRILGAFNIDRKRIEALLQNKEFNEPATALTYLLARSDESKATLEEYRLRHGDVYSRAREGYIAQLVECGKKDQQIQEFLKRFTDEQVKQMVRSRIFSTYRDVALDFLENLDRRGSANMQAQMDQFKRTREMESSSLNLAASNGSLSIEKGQAAGGRAIIYEDKAESYFLQLRDYISGDPILSQVLRVLLQKSENEAIEKVRLALVQLAVTVYKEKVKQILRKEVSEFKVITPLLTQDGASPLVSRGQEQSASELDSMLQKLLTHDFHNMVSSHVFFLLSVLGLEELGAVFRQLSKISQKIQMDNLEKAEDILGLFYQHSYKLKSMEQVTELTHFLNKVTETLAFLYYFFREKLIFPEDRLFEQHTKSQMIKERDHNNLSFMNYAVTAHMEHAHYNSKIKQLKGQMGVLEPADEQLTFSYNLETLAEELERKYNLSKPTVQKLQGTITQQLNQLQSNQNMRAIIISAISYIEKMDILTHRAIYGKQSVRLPALPLSSSRWLGRASA